MGTWKKLAYADDAILKSLLTEQGDIIYASGVATPAALAHGLVTQYLRSGGHAANPSWDTPAGGGAILTIAETEVFNGAAPTAWTDLDLSGTIGANAALVLIKVKSVVSTYTRAFRRNGDLDEVYALSSVSGTNLIDLGANLFVLIFVPTDTGGVIEWKCENNGSMTLDVVAYIK